MAKTKTKKTTSKKTTSKKTSSTANRNLPVLVMIPLDPAAIKAWKAHLRHKQSKIQQAGRLARIQAVLTVLNRSKESLNFCSSQEAEAVQTALQHYLFKVAGQPRIQYYLLATWKTLANKQITKILNRKNGTELELRNSAEFQRILTDIDLRISKAENARAFASQKDRVEASFGLFQPLEEAYNAVADAINDCKEAEAAASTEEVSPSNKAATSKTSKKKKARGRKVKAEASKTERASADVVDEAAPITSEPEAEIEVEPSDDVSDDEQAAAQEAAMADMATEDFVEDPAAADPAADNHHSEEADASEDVLVTVDDVDDDPFQPEEGDIELMSNADIISRVDGDDDRNGSEEYHTDGQWALNDPDNDPDDDPADDPADDDNNEQEERQQYKEREEQQYNPFG